MVCEEGYKFNAQTIPRQYPGTPWERNKLHDKSIYGNQNCNQNLKWVLEVTQSNT